MVAARTFDGPPPPWVNRLSDASLRHRLGSGAFERGVRYARDNAVTSVSTGDRGRMLMATVRGSGRSSYQTLVAVEGDRPDGSVRWTGRCSCPVRQDCKHVAAVILTTRHRLAGTQQPAKASWEMQLADLVRPEPEPERAEARLGLQLDVVTRKPSRYAHSPVAVPRLRLRPVTPGKSGDWIKTGVSWRELHTTHSRVPIGAHPLEAVLAIVTQYRAGQPAYVSPYSDPQIHLDDLGRNGWRLLATAQESGVQLLRGGRSRSAPRAGDAELTGPAVQLAQGPASIVLDLRQPAQADVELAVVVRIPGEADLAPDRVSAVGDPAHGLFVDDPDRLLLAPFDRPLDDATSRLLTGGAAVSIPADDMPRFLSGFYPALRHRVRLDSTDGSVTFPDIQPPRLALAVRFEPRHRTALHWEFAYELDQEVVRVPIDRTTADPTRDVTAEDALLESLVELDAVPGLRVDVGSQRRLVPDTGLEGLDTAIFAEQVLPGLSARDDIWLDVDGTPADYVESDQAPLISVSASDSADPEATDWFDLGIAVSVGGQDVPFARLFTALAGDEGHLILDSGTWFRLDRPELQAMRRLIEEARSLEDRDSDSLRVTPWQAGLWEELVSLGVVEHQSERWSRTAGALLDLEQVPRPDPPAALCAKLRPYQLDGYQWLSLLWDHQLGGILADDMGLGKTLQTLAMAARAHERGTLTEEAPLLIVAPTSVVSTWASESARFCPQLRVVTVTETESRSGSSVRGVTAGAHLVVTSYALLRIDEEAYRRVSWSGLVLDEAQFVKNHQAKTYQCARRLPAPFKLAITGTPLENSLMDLWSLLSIAAPGLFPHPQRFTELYRKPIESGRSPERLATLRRRIRPLMLRRSKEQVAPELPPKVEQTLDVVLNPQHRRVYDKHLQRERQRVLGLIGDMQRNRIAIFRSLTLLRQLSLDASLIDDRYAGRIRSSKVDTLMEQLHEVAAEGHRALVFSQFTGFLALVRKQLRADGIAHCYLDGRTRDRPRRIAEFTGGDAPVFLISLKAGGFGLNLTEADYVFVLDPWWNPAAEAQAIDRTHRIGQDKTVMVYRLVATDTIEEKVVALQQRKRALFARVVDEDGALAAQLSADDIRGLFER